MTPPRNRPFPRLWRTRWPLASVRSYLHVITLVAVLPIALLTSWLIGRQVSVARDQLAMGLQHGASSMALMIDREQSASVEAMQALADSPQLQRGDTRGFERFLKAFVSIRPAWSQVSLVDARSGQVLSSVPGDRAAVDEPLPSDFVVPRSPTDAAPHYSGLIRGPRAGEWHTRITMPVWRADQLRYYLHVDIEEKYWQNLIVGASPQRQGFVTLYDRSKTVIARTVTPNVHIGQPLQSHPVRNNRPNGFQKIEVDGEGDSYVAWQEIAHSGWGVRIGVSAAALDHNKLTAFVAIAGTGIVSLFAGLLLSRMVATRIIKPLSILSQGMASSLRDEDTTVFEISMLRNAMLAAEQQRDLATQRLQAKAAEFETLFLMSPIGLSITLDPQADEVLRNPAKMALFNTPNQGAHTYDIVVDGRVLPPSEHPLKRAARGERIHNLDLEVRHQDGRVLKLIAYALPLLDLRGKPRGAIAVFVDVTERVLSQNKLLLAQARLEDNQHFITLAQKAGDVGFWDHRIEENRLTLTSGLSLLFGMGQDETEITWEDWLAKIKHPDEATLTALLREAWQDHQEQVNFQLQIQLGDMPERWLACRGVCMYNAQGAPIRMIGAVVDVTAQHQIEHERSRLIEQEQVARREAEQANRAKDEFLAILGHELRNPLGAISAGIEVLNRISPQGDQPARMRQIISRQTRHLARLMDDLLDVARVIAGKIQLSVHPVSVRATVQRVVNTFKITGLSQAVEIDVDDVWVQADSVRLEQIINNLITNAGKYSPPDLVIQVIGKAHGPVVRLQVINHGPLIPPTLLPHIFDLFVQGERTIERRQGGLGIGLTLVKSLVDLHHGKVEVTTSDDRNIFTVELPAAQPDERAAAESPNTATDRRRVVIVEDNDDAREAVQLMLEVGGHEVSAHTDGDTGLHAILQKQPDLALVDIGLPGRSGYEVARAAREAGFGGWLIALSGYGQQQDVQRALDNGFDFHMVKPLDQQLLEAYLARPAREQNLSLNLFPSG